MSKRKKKKNDVTAMPPEQESSGDVVEVVSGPDAPPEAEEVVSDAETAPEAPAEEATAEEAAGDEVADPTDAVDPAPGVDEIDDVEDDDEGEDDEAVNEAEQDDVTDFAPSPENIAGAVEAMLFTTTEPVGLVRLTDAIPNVTKEEVAQALEALRARYEAAPGCGLILVDVAGGFQIFTRPAYADVVSKFLDRRRSTAISRAALETLAIIAYRQPLTRAEIAAIRGVDVSSAFKTLLEKKLVKISGRKEVPGRPYLYITTKRFLEFFGLKNTKDLPSFEEFQRMMAEKEELGADHDAVDAIEQSLGVTHHEEADVEPTPEDGVEQVAVEEGPDDEAAETDEETPGT